MFKKVLVVLAAVAALLTSVNYADAAKSNDKFSVRFRENTLVVSSAKMEEARIYSLQGKLLQKGRGHFAEFELERGSYRLYAKVDGQTITRRIELR